mmetsp:Transcript_31402/g.55243  ORF Transcript_31402/g.55243 Transcript_31402/m.55243 type:complete len:309 (+) Transcript_31402:120-1046(+)|eukprot:CAMPEP_0197519276 /NCGR_PEP_ID=MMETSP1318-20131121/4537_1 /TAXON_ID=552666 /ORGANISM="Partenskyella glossopodia, Strain RCC365" /LENGTH=308 /DNA_ID=CAMNT_0043070153 /DNA_START=136 /DNA_END=1062 /DNA_ORIENTATION=-
MSAAIIGAGSVGSTIASFMIQGGKFHEILMVDVNKSRCEGEVMDLNDAGFTTDTSVRMGDFKDCAKCSIVIITAGAKQRSGETRRALLKRNVKILKSICKSILPLSPSTMVLLVANPVDILTQIFQKISGLPKEQVMGSGTYLDTMRLRTALSKRFNVAASHVHAQVIGMHGDLQMAVWSKSTIAGIPIPEYDNKGLTQGDMDKMAQWTKDKAYKIIQAKGSTYYGIAACVTKISAGILQDRHQVFQLSCYHEGYGSYLSWPALVGRSGVVRLMPLQLTGEEIAHVKKAAEHVTKGANEALLESVSKL